MLDVRGGRAVLVVHRDHGRIRTGHTPLCLDPLAGLPLAAGKVLFHSSTVWNVPSIAESILTSSSGQLPRVLEDRYPWLSPVEAGKDFVHDQLLVLPRTNHS